MEKVWPWVSLASYLGAALMCAVWITDGGSHNTRVPRWKIWAVCLGWPFMVIFGLVERFVEWFFQPPALPRDENE